MFGVHWCLVGGRKSIFDHRLETSGHQTEFKKVKKSRKESIFDFSTFPDREKEQTDVPKKV